MRTSSMNVALQDMRQIIRNNDILLIFGVRLSRVNRPYVEGWQEKT